MLYSACRTARTSVFSVKSRCRRPVVRAMTRGAKRIVCLTEETTETLYLLGAQDHIVGISGFTVRPARARKEKPKVSAFTSANIDKITSLQPDLVLGFSDLQADIAAQLVRAGIAVHVFNQRTVSGILDMIAIVGTLVGEHDAANALVECYEQRIAEARNLSRTLTRRPRVYFEEWNDPLISGIGWVSELIDIAGGIDCYADLAHHAHAKHRIIADPLDVVRRAPDIIIGSWCGKRFRPEIVAQRPGWNEIPAIKTNAIFEIKSCDILQPGPAALTDGLDQLQRIVLQWAAGGTAS